MTGTPLVSVVIPCFNDGPFLREAIASVTDNRSVPPIWEIVVVNDGSTDAGTLSILDAVRSPGIRVLDQPNRGLGAARNRGIREASGRYIIPLDADNRLREAYFVEGVQLLERDPSTAVVYGDAWTFGDRSGPWVVPGFSLETSLGRNTLDACALFRRSVWEDVGGYDETMPVMGFEDWDFWIRVHRAGGVFRKIGGVCFDYRIRSDSMLRTLDDRARQEARRHILLKHPDLMVDDYLVYDTLRRFSRRNPAYGVFRAVMHFLKQGRVKPRPEEGTSERHVGR